LSSLRREFVIDCFLDDPPAYRSTHAIVAIDVFRATTTLVTAAAGGRRCYPVASIEAAHALAGRLSRPLLAGELGGSMPYGFDANNSPAEFAFREDIERPAIMLSTSGTRLLTSSRGAPAVFAACLRNWSAQVERLADGEHPRVALLGAGTRGEFREEDQLCCAWIGEGLIAHGFRAATEETTRVIERWRGAPVSALAHGPSATYLRRTGQIADLEFVLRHVDDLDMTFVLDGEELITEERRRARRSA